MSKRVLALLLSSALVISTAACGVTATIDVNTDSDTEAGAEDTKTETQGSSDQTKSGEESVTSEIDYTTGTPWIDSDLEGNVTADTEVSLKDNYVLAVNKDKILDLEIPEGYPSYGTLAEVYKETNEQIQKLFLGDEPKNHDAKLAYDLFWLLMDWEGRDKVGVEPLKKITDAIEGIKSVDDLTKYVLDTKNEDQIAALWSGASTTDLEDSDHHIIAVAYCELMLEDSAEYSTLTDYGKIKKDAYTDLARKMLGKLGYSDDEIQQKLDNCFAFETAVSESIPSDETRKSPDFLSSIYNIYSYDELDKLQENIPILEKLKRDGYPEADKYMVLSPDYITKLNELYTDDNLSLMKDYMIVNGVIGSASKLDKECYEWKTECSNAISGASGSRSDEEVFTSYVSSTLDWQVGRMYSDAYLKPEDKERLSEMVDEILDAYHGVIESADFLSDETKEKAIEKLESINKAVLYPDDWSKYSTEDLNFKSKDEGGTLWDALASINAYKIKDEAKKYPEARDKEKWGNPPNFFNCQYNSTTNTIYLYGAFCQSTIYNSKMSDEELYGKLGWVTGHEISHAFDSKGAQFDKDGNMADWWTEEDYTAFQERNKKLADYFNNMHPWEGQDFKGDIMTGEAGADMAGMKVILMIVKDKKDFDYDKMFRSLGDVWLEKGTLQSAYDQINDVHPMGYLRVNCTLQQFDEFLDLYDIKEGDGMYLAPEDRVIVW